MEIYLDEFAVNDPLNGVYLDAPIEGLAGLPGIRTSQGVNVGKDGGWTGNQLYDPRFVSFPMYIYGSVLQVEAKRREFAAVLHRKRLTMRIVTQAGYEYTTGVVVLDAPAPITRVINRTDYKINLKADDPILYDDGGNDDLLALVQKTVAGGFEIPFELPLEIEAGSDPSTVHNAGNETVLPYLLIKTTGTNPQLINKTTNQMIKINMSTADGNELKIDMKNETVTYNGGNIYNLRAAGSKFWGLIPGDNIIELVTDIPSEQTEAELYYRSGFLTV